MFLPFDTFASSFSRDPYYDPIRFKSLEYNPLWIPFTIPQREDDLEADRAMLERYQEAIQREAERIARDRQSHEQLDLAQYDTTQRRQTCPHRTETSQTKLKCGCVIKSHPLGTHENDDHNSYVVTDDDDENGQGNDDHPDTTDDASMSEADSEIDPEIDSEIDSEADPETDSELDADSEFESDESEYDSDETNSSGDDVSDDAFEDDEHMLHIPCITCKEIMLHLEKLYGRIESLEERLVTYAQETLESDLEQELEDRVSSPKEPEYEIGQIVMYNDDGAMREARIVCINNSYTPWSYTIQLQDDNGVTNFRDTEFDRLAPIT